MRFARNRTKTDCGPVAIYNTALALEIPFARGGYRGWYPELAWLCYDGHGSGTETHLVLPALYHVLQDTSYTAKFTYPGRCRWSWVLTRLMRESPGMGLLEVEFPVEGLHLAFIWMAFGTVWAANWTQEFSKVPLWFWGDDRWWPTKYNAVQPLHFWQIRRRV